MLYEQLFTVGIAFIIFEVQYFAVECHVIDVMWLYYYSTVECKQFIHAAAALFLGLIKVGTRLGRPRVLLTSRARPLVAGQSQPGSL